MKRIDIKITFQCNNCCKFCVQGNKREVCSNKDNEEIKKILRGSKKEYQEVVFTGGDPTIRPDIIELVRYAGDLGYGNIQIQTNGRMFAYRKFCQEIVEAGASEFAVSLHGHNSCVHEDLTSANGSFNQTVAGILNLKKLGQRVITNTVITKSNYRYLPQIAELLVRLGVEQYQFAYIHILGKAEINLKQLVPRKTEIMGYVQKGLDIGIKAGRKVMTEAIPYCFMAGYEKYIAEEIIPATKIFEAEYSVEDYTKYRQNEGKVKGPQCPECRYARCCEGPWKEYPKIFGWSEFKSVK